MTKHTILIIEDEYAIRTGLQEVFVFHGYDTKVAEDGEVGLRWALCENFDLIVLDVMLPKIDGFSLCDRVKREKPEQAIIMLTAKSEDDDVVQGLALGADDYVTKPFSIRELVLRAEAVLRRSHSHTPKGPLRLSLGSHLDIDLRDLRGTLRGAEAKVEFTRKEVEILLYLAQRPDRLVTRDELLSEVWGYERASQIETRTVDIHIAKLRRKIEPLPKQPRFLVTVRGEGYRLVDATTDA